jgi:hypothetical protein
VGVPRFRPASIFVNCRDFGRNPYARPVPTPHLRPGQRAWAIYQHQVATSVLKELRRRDLRVNNLARQLDADYEWLLRKLYGRVPADLGEMFEWCAALGLEMVRGPEFALVKRPPERTDDSGPQHLETRRP